MDFLEIFNAKFADMLEDLTILFGDDTDLTILRTGFAIARAASKESAWRVFRDQVEIPYGQSVLARDESFFLGNGTFNVGNGDAYALAIVERVRGAWRTMDPNNKSAIWKHFILLVQLSQRIPGR